MNDSGIYPEWYSSWQMKMYGNVIKRNIVLPPDERTQDEIQQDRFDKMQQQFEIERESEAGRPGVEC